MTNEIENDAEIVLGTFKLERNLWLDFQFACKRDGSDASKELRKFVDQYLNS
jgi:hypothetical protein